MKILVIPALPLISISLQSFACSYKKPANWELVSQVAATSAVPLIGNGDVLTHYEVPFSICSPSHRMPFPDVDWTKSNHRHLSLLTSLGKLYRTIPNNSSCSMGCQSPETVRYDFSRRAQGKCRCKVIGLLNEAKSLPDTRWTLHSSSYICSRIHAVRAHEDLSGRGLDSTPSLMVRMSVNIFFSAA